MKILVTGANGQLGRELFDLHNNFNNYEFIFTDVNELDITNSNQLNSFFENNSIDLIINAAAYTAVDKAESDIENAFRINRDAAINLVDISNKYNAYLVHVSTDYVFDGESFCPYTEEVNTNPKSVYGKSKLEGERYVFDNLNKGIIIRTSWLYSSYGNNFVKTILRLINERNEVKVIFDQVGTPTYAKGLAEAILKIIPQMDLLNKVEIYNYSDEGVASWYDFALAISEFSSNKCNIIPIETVEYPTPASRPFYSILNKKKIKTTFNIEIPYWRDNLKVCIEKLLK